MITKTAIKVHYLVLFALILTTIRGYSQNIKYTTFRDYRLVPNIDTLEKEVRSKKNNPEQYLHGLITLEINRMDYHGFFGQDLKTIKTLAYQLNSSLAIATHQYLEGYFLKEQNLVMSARNTLKAIQYFESTKDTSGMIASYYSILYLNVFGNPYKINDSKNSTFYYNRILSLGQQSRVLRDKVERIRTITNLKKVFSGQKLDKKTALSLIKESEQIINQNPNITPLNIFLYGHITRLYSLIYNIDGQQLYVQEMQKYKFKTIEAQKKRSSKINITDCLNTAFDYPNKNRFEKAEKHLLKAINVMEQLKEEYRDNRIYYELYKALSEAQFMQKDYEAAKDSREKSIEIYQNRYHTLKSSFFEELNTQYVLEQKEIENTQLKQSKQLAELRSQLFKTIFIISLIALFIVFVLLYFLYKSFKKQKSLLHFRDQLFAIIAHDLRSPMSMFQRYSDIIAYLVKTQQYERLNSVTKKIDQIGINLSMLLNNLLAWSLKQQGIVKNSTELINTKAFFNELLPIYHEMANLNSLELVENIEEIEINLDPDKLALIIRNVLDNSIKFSEENNQINLSALRHRNEFLLKISNKSSPASIHQKTALKKLLESDNDFIIGNNNLGVGSILVKQYAKIMGAKITFDYDVNCLTIFTFSLPLTTET